MGAHLKPITGRLECDGPLPSETARLEVERALRGSSHCELRQVRCRFCDGVATLSGEVSSFYLKQIAQTIVCRLPHVRKVNNQLHVVSNYVFPYEA